MSRDRQRIVERYTIHGRKEGRLMARIDSAYNYFISTYAKDIGNRYESHKKSELRDTYNKIIKTNKESPLYKINDTEDIGQFAIDIKEHANAMSLSVSNLSAMGDNIESIMSKRMAHSTNSDAVDAIYVGDSDSPADDFTVEVSALATPQINTGNFLAANGRNFEDGQYSFDLDIRNHSYEFQFNVNRGESNLDIQQKIIRLINSSDVGLSANLISNNKSENAIQIYSKSTGLNEDENYIFSISSNTCWRELNILGIQNMTHQASNSVFSLNGNEHSSLSNTFTVNKAFELILKTPTMSPVTVGLMNDTEALSHGITQMLDSYNGMLDVGLRYTNSHQNRALFNEMSTVTRGMSEQLSSAGIIQDDYHHLVLDKEGLSNAINSEARDETFATLNKLKNAISTAASKASINPLAYVDKSVVEYKNPNKSLAAPYAASAYSGMMMNYGL